jgi:hypothetical protein
VVGEAVRLTTGPTQAVAAEGDLGRHWRIVLGAETA